jgi:Ca2+-binding RTX toxin-like protein
VRSEIHDPCGPSFTATRLSSKRLTNYAASHIVHARQWVSVGFEAIYGYGGADRIHAWGGDDTLRLGDGLDKGQGGRGDDYIRAVDGSEDFISCGPGADRVKANPGNNVAEACEKVIRADKRVD